MGSIATKIAQLACIVIGAAWCLLCMTNVINSEWWGAGFFLLAGGYTWIKEEQERY